MKPNQDRLTNIDGEIDATLNLLRKVQPPTGMMSRLHLRLETATAGRARLGWLFWVPTACAAMAMIVLVISIQTHSTRGKQTSAVDIAKSVVAPTAFYDRAMTQPALVASETSHDQKLHVHSSYRRRFGTSRHAANLLSYPLTRQEKLLIRFVQTATPADLRDLNPEYQARMEAEREAKFAAYLKSGSSSSYNETTENTQE